MMEWIERHAENCRGRDFFVGDLHDGGSFLGGGAAAASASSSGWVLVTYVPDSCSSLDAKKATDNKDGLKAGLGAERFCGEMHVRRREQICLSGSACASPRAPEAGRRTNVRQRQVGCCSGSRDCRACMSFANFCHITKAAGSPRAFGLRVRYGTQISCSSAEVMASSTHWLPNA